MATGLWTGGGGPVKVREENDQRLDNPRTKTKRPAALPTLRSSLSAVRVVRDPAPVDVGRLTPPELSPKDRPLLAAALVAYATHFVTGDVADFGRWMDRRARLPLRVMTPRQFLTEVHP